MMQFMVYGLWFVVILNANSLRNFDLQKQKGMPPFTGSMPLYISKLLSYQAARAGKHIPKLSNNYELQPINPQLSVLFVIMTLLHLGRRHRRHRRLCGRRWCVLYTVNLDVKYQRFKRLATAGTALGTIPLVKRNV